MALRLRNLRSAGHVVRTSSPERRVRCIRVRWGDGVIREASMDQTTITNKKTANGVLSKKRARQSDESPLHVSSPAELQDLLQALRAMRAGDFSVQDGRGARGTPRKNRRYLQRHRRRERANGATARARRPGRRSRRQNPSSREIRSLATVPGARWKARSIR